MITIPSLNNAFSVTFQADYVDPATIAMYTLSKSSIKVVRYTNAGLSVVKVHVTPNGGSTTITTYYTDPNGVLEIPLHNTINAIFADGIDSMVVSVFMYDTDGTSVDTSVYSDIDIIEGVSYLDIVAPLEKDIAGVAAAVAHDIITPPNVMFNPATLGGVASPGIIVESNLNMGGVLQNWGSRAGGVVSGIVPNGARENQLNVPASADTLLLTDGNVGGSVLKTWKLEKTDSCADMVCVRWKSLTGAKRQHFFPIVARTTGADKAVSLLSPADGYDVDKNAFNGVTCRITGLTKYGYWYYADLFRSSDVHAIILPTHSIFETEISNAQTAVYVEPLTTETPQGNGFYNFEFSLKLRHYDTF